MAFQDIIETIKEEAEEKKKALVQEKEKNLSLLKQQYEAKIKAERKKILKNAEEKTNAKTIRAISRARKNARILILKKKREIMDKIYQTAFERIANLTSEEQRQILEKLLDKAAAEIKNENVQDSEIEIISTLKNKEIIEQLLKEKSYLWKLKDQELDSINGFIIKTKKFNINCCFEPIFEKIKQESEIEISRELFENIANKH